MIGELAAHPAVGAEGVDLLLGRFQAQVIGRHQRPGGAGLYALATGNAAAVSQGVADIEHDGRFSPATGVADHVVDLHFTAGAQAAGALDTGVQIDRDSRMGEIRSGLMAAWKPGFSQLQFLRPVV